MKAVSYVRTHLWARKFPALDRHITYKHPTAFSACCIDSAFGQNNNRKQFADTKNAAPSGSKPSVARQESRVLPTGVLEDNAAEFVSLGDNDNLVERDGGRLGSGGELDSEEEEEEEEEEDGEDFDEAYDGVAGLEGAVLL